MVAADGLGHLPLWEAAVEAHPAEVLAHGLRGVRGSQGDWICVLGR
jgi:hypothetical protein